MRVLRAPRRAPGAYDARVARSWIARALDDGDHDDEAPAPLVPSLRVPPIERRSLYLTMRDGVRVAIDAYVPRGARAAPTILRQTRYLRSLDAPEAVGALFDLYARTRRVFLAAGYAWVDVDVRGTGASSGRWACPWSPEEVRDGAEVVDWIVRQPWSSGRVGSLGVSYDGTAADMLVTTQHPAVRAVAPLFSLYDVYADVAFPGGIQLAGFTALWSAYNAALDRDAFGEGMGGALYLLGRAGAVSPSPRGLERLLGPLARDAARWKRTVPPVLGALVRGVRAVDEDRDRSRLAEAVRDRDNVDIHERALAITHRDQTGLSPYYPNDSIDLFSPHRYASEASASGAAICSVSGWRDGAYPHSSIKRFASVRTPGSRLVLGPWVHSGRLRIVPFGVARAARFDLDAELLAFFDAHLRERPYEAAAVRYYTMVEARWKSASSWPPPGTRTLALHLHRERGLRAEPPREAGADVHHETGTTGTGERSRWRSLLSLVPGDYPDRRERDAELLVWDSAPLEHDLEVTGHPQVTLHVSWDDADDGHVFAYLEDVAPDGRVAYVTEGQLRALFRRRVDPPPCASPAAPRAYTRADASPVAAGEVVEVAFDLLPISWLFRRGHRVRLAIAGADRDHFEVLSPRTFRVHRSDAHPSRVELPIATT